MIENDLYRLAMSTFGALGQAVAAARARTPDAETPQPTPLLRLRRGLAESPAWFLVQAAEFDPEPLSVVNLRVRDVYASARIVQALLELMASEGWFDRIDGAPDTYHLTAAGRAALDHLLEESRAAIAGLAPLPAADLARLEGLLRRIVEASLASDDPPGVWCLAHSRGRAPDESAPPLLKITQYFGDFNAFRDDAHMAAWQPLAVEGYVWEAFSFVWRGDAGSPEALFEQLAYRGYSRAEYAAALGELARRGWVEPDPDPPGSYRLTGEGRTVRDEAERRTDDYFYAPWSYLDEGEVAEVRHLLLQLRDGLRRLAEPPPA